MKKFSNTLIWLLSGMLLLGSCSPARLNYVNKTEFSADFLVGTWKLKDSNSYEKWAKTGPAEWLGVAYDMSSGQAMINEYLRIYKSDKDWLLEVKIKENGFNPVLFRYMPDPFWLLLFKNEKNDFPNLIGYRSGGNGILYAQIRDLKGLKMVDFEFSTLQDK